MIVIMTALGFIRGLFKTVISFFGWFLCILIAYLLAKAVGNALLTPKMAQTIVNGKLFEAVFGMIPDGLKEVSMNEIRQMLADGATSEQVFEYVRSLSGTVIGFAFTVMRGAITKDIYLNSQIESAGQVLALELTYQIYIVLVGIAIFIVLRVIVMGVSVLFGGKLVGREIKLWERLGGLGLGAVRGFVCACILTMVLGFAAGFSSKLKEQTDVSNVAVPATDWINEKMSAALAKGNDGNERFQNLIDALEEKISNENGSVET